MSQVEREPVSVTDSAGWQLQQQAASDCKDYARELEGHQKKVVDRGDGFDENQRPA